MQTLEVEQRERAKEGTKCTASTFHELSRTNALHGGGVGSPVYLTPRYHRSVRFTTASACESTVGQH